jgi:hypothetical protein
LLRYIVGDEITARMKMWHRMNLLSAEVVFEHGEDPAITLTLSGVPEFLEYVPLWERPEVTGSPGEPYKVSEVLLSGEVGLEHIPGNTRSHARSSTRLPGRTYNIIYEQISLTRRGYRSGTPCSGSWRSRK